MKNDQQELHEELKKRFSALPETLQKAITSAEVEAHLRKLAEGHKLHLDQWQKLENEVTMTILGLQRAADLSRIIEKHVGVKRETAEKISNDIAQTVFKPIRDEMERVLGAPDTGGTKTAREKKESVGEKRAAPPSDLSEHYRPGELSAKRRAIEGDPYREPAE